MVCWCFGSINNMSMVCWWYLLISNVGSRKQTEFFNLRPKQHRTTMFVLTNISVWLNELITINTLAQTLALALAFALLYKTPIYKSLYKSTDNKPIPYAYSHTHINLLTYINIYLYIYMMSIIVLLLLMIFQTLRTLSFIHFFFGVLKNKNV